MVFSSTIFLTVFLPAVLLLYLAVPRGGRNAVLLVSSVLFYYWGAASHALVLVWVVAVSYAGARIVDSRSGRVPFGAVVFATLLPLLWFKYAAFFSATIEPAFSGIGLGFDPLASRVLPVGISFFSFQALSYVIDVRRGDAPRLQRADHYLMYISLFPQLIAGPIVRFSEIRHQLTDRRFTAENLAAGATRFSHGLAKKVLVADSVAPIADAAFAAGDARGTAAAWLGIAAYSIQIYFDFSGYSDMAIGLGRMFGFDFPENFARPYSSASISEFWRRWHITLSNWFRDYVYFPLGGSRLGVLAEYRNLIIVFLLTALWHGAAWTFLVWGGIHGAWLIVERVTRLRELSGLVWMRRTVTMLVVLVGWVFFRASDVGAGAHYVADMFWWDAEPWDPSIVVASTYLNLTILALGVATLALPKTWVTGIRVASPNVRWPAGTQTAYMAIATLASLVFVASRDFSPFLYFQF